MDSHEYAGKLQELAAYLLEKPMFAVPNSESGKQYFWYIYDKEGFIGAVKTLGAGRKEIGIEYVDFYPVDAPLHIRIERNSVCKLVKPAEYDCEPFLKPQNNLVIDTFAAKATQEVDEIPF